MGQPGSAQAKEAFVSLSRRGDGKGHDRGKGKGKSKGKSHPGGKSAAVATGTAVASQPGGANAEHTRQEGSSDPSCPNHNKDGVIGKMLKMWESFVEHASIVRLPIPIFLRVSIPLMLACIEGIMTASIAQMPHTGVVGAAEFDNILNIGASLHDWKPSTTGGEFLSEDNLCMLANMADDFHNISLELIGIRTGHS